MENCVSAYGGTIMKRFYCTVCRKVRRARKLPVLIQTPNAPVVTERVGECDSHTRGARHNSSLNSSIRLKVAR